MTNALIKNEYLTKNQSTVDRRSFMLLPTKKAIDLVESTYRSYFKNMKFLKEQLGAKKYNDLILLIDEANNILLGASNNE